LIIGSLLAASLSAGSRGVPARVSGSVLPGFAGDGQSPVLSKALGCPPRSQEFFLVRLVIFFVSGPLGGLVGRVIALVGASLYFGVGLAGLQSPLGVDLLLVRLVLSAFTSLLLGGRIVFLQLD
jgi:hypothetical protein